MGKRCTCAGGDIDEKETALVFAGGQWTILGEASVIRLSTERRVIIDTLADNPEPMTPTELSAAVCKPLNNIKQLLFKMVKAGEIQRAGKGRYEVTR